ncbi:acyl-CoA dehydrogenase family protein [Hydrogenophaga sp.]|uniref:acyl-CoA dehydrogenase family protein n=1 Tax=Hydrogenophaga sp. TaxID=1904254 RepID=UPI002724160F|nr:acyl-CoA dehydrogenase family protein [Hydrogenophaga sp.]MDO9438472.1 acyl-CoA dehydrogenase family protein [Hydrogenophaga sp.]
MTLTLEHPPASTTAPQPAGADLLLERALALRDGLAAGASARDLERGLPHAEMRELAASGILAARVPRAFGGPEVSVLELVRIFVAIAQGDPNIAQAMQPHACGIEKIRLYGTPAQQRHFFDIVLGGNLITNAAAERGGGFIGAIRTALKADGDRWQLDGTKHYATGSLFASHFYVLARRGDEDEARGLAIVPLQREGVRVLDDWDGMGQRTTASGTAIFERVRVEPIESLNLPAAGSRRTHEGAFAQVLHAAIDTGIALAALADAARYGREKARPMPEARVTRASDDPFVQHAVGEMAVLAHAAEAMVERGARILDAALAQGVAAGAADQALGEASVAVAEAKMAANEASLRVSEMLYRVGGAGATVRPLNLDRHWRNARTHTTHDPVAYKAKAVGDYYLNNALPPINTKI